MRNADSPAVRAVRRLREFGRQSRKKETGQGEKMKEKKKKKKRETERGNGRDNERKQIRQRHTQRERGREKCTAHEARGRRCKE